MVEVVGLRHQPGTAAKVFRIFSRRGASLEFISQSKSTEDRGSITVCISSRFADRIDEFAHDIIRDVKPERIYRHPDVVMLTIYGPHFAEIPNIASRLCMVMGNANINIHGISTAINSVTCVIDEKDLSKATECLNTAFEAPE